jgi:hypothetical protein
VRDYLRTWTDSEGCTWRIFLNERPTYEPGKLLIFTQEPKTGMSCPKILVRGLRDVYSLPDSALPFFLDCAKRGGFVWRDRDGTPWHIHNRTHVRNRAGRSLEIQHGASHRPLWQSADEELQRLVEQSLALDSG